MLIEYTIENFRSIANKTKFSMVPARGTSKAYNLIPLSKNSNYKNLLKSSVIYGPNASGKSNIINALTIVKRMVINSKNNNKGDNFDNEYQPFILDSQHSNSPCYFELLFINNEIEYKYSFSYNLEKIVTEELSYFIKKKEVYIYKRKENDFEPFIDHQELNSLFSHTGDNVLFLSKANNEYKKFGPIFEWFNKNLKTLGPLSKLNDKFSIRYMNKSNENKEKILKFLQYADFDISNISGEFKKFDDFKNLLDHVFSHKSSSLEISLTKGDTDNNIDRSKELEITELKSVRKKVDGSEIIQEFLNFESSGTIQFFKISGIWLDALQDHQRILTIDEFEINLHPDLQKYLVEVFLDPKINIKNSQLILITHNTRLLSTKLFRREQIWFTEKNPDTKSTEILSLYDYEERTDKSIEKGYFFGRYGGLPNIKYGKI
jgi:uncharacterized protein